MNGPPQGTKKQYKTAAVLRIMPFQNAKTLKKTTDFGPGRPPKRENTIKDDGFPKKKPKSQKITSPTKNLKIILKN